MCPGGGGPAIDTRPVANAFAVRGGATVTNRRCDSALQFVIPTRGKASCLGTLPASAAADRLGLDISLTDRKKAHFRGASIMVPQIPQMGKVLLMHVFLNKGLSISARVLG